MNYYWYEFNWFSVWTDDTDDTDDTDEQTALFNCLSSYFFFFFFAHRGCINSYGITFICEQEILELKMDTFKLEN